MGRAEWLTKQWARVRSAFWLVPGLLVALLLLLAVVLVELDRRAGDHGIDLVYGGGASAARSILAALAGSLITVAGLTFSIMIVTLQLASSQYSPRVIRTFLGDRLTQAVAGIFVGVFGYTLIVLRSVRGGAGETGTAIPSLSVSVAIVLAIGALGLLIVFVHHMSGLIQVSTITARVGRETYRCLERPFPAAIGEPLKQDAEALLAGLRALSPPGTIGARRAGFVQIVTPGAVARRAADEGVTVHLTVSPGTFVTPCSALAEVWPAAAAEAFADVVEDAVTIGQERDLREDCLFGVRQLADIALRALSPGVNDPTTARTCLHYIQAVLERLAADELPGRVRCLHGAVLVVDAPQFGAFVDVALTEVAVAAAGQPRIAPAVLDTLAAVRAAAVRHGQPEHARDCEDAARAVGEILVPAARSERDRLLVRGSLERAVGGAERRPVRRASGPAPGSATTTVDVHGR